MPKSSGIRSDLSLRWGQARAAPLHPAEPFEKTRLKYMRSLSGNNTEVHLLVSEVQSPLA